MSELNIYLFGPPRVECDGVVVEIGRRKAVAILAYLAVTGGPQSRNTLATLFWPDYAAVPFAHYCRRSLASSLRQEVHIGTQATHRDRDR